jgi:chromosome segregation protein
MKLKRLDISGFKSFCERSSIEFPQGVSAIVGPNGCGKSNIVDALRWVMGEQSVKQLRGKSMEDVIFAGANGKPPLNMAEVTLTLRNDNGSAPEELKDFTEIMLTRRLYRSGESAYFLNKQPCRLKDILNVFLGSGIGSKSYAVIQQGNIGAIIDAGPEERRYFIEEAAGTTRFKTRKTEALRKVESTQQNLLRLSDIIAEIKRQMTGLKRQARKAERYRLYQERIKEVDLRLTLRQYAELTRQIEKTDGLLEDLKATDLGHSAQLKKLDAAVEDIKLRRWQKNQEISEQKSRKFELLRQTDRIENDAAHLKEDSARLADEAAQLRTAHDDLEQKNRQIEREIEASQAEHRQSKEQITTVKAAIEKEQADAAKIKEDHRRLQADLEQSKSVLMDYLAQEARYKNISQNAANNRENLKRRLKRADEEAATARKQVSACGKQEEQAQNRLETCRRTVVDLDERLAAARNRSDTMREKLREHVKAVQTLEFERNTAKSTLSNLKKMEENFEWYREGVRAIMTDSPFAGPDAGANPSSSVLGMLADVIEPEADYRTAVEAVLGETLQYILVSAPETGVQAIEYLQDQGAGRSGFIPLTAVLTGNAGGRSPGNSADCLLDHVSVRSGYEKIVEALLGDVLVADTFDEARHLFNHNGHHKIIAAKDGTLIYQQGVMVGGSQEKLPGILAKKQEIRDLAAKIERLESDLNAAREAQGELEDEARTLEIDLQQLTEKKRRAERDEIEAEKAAVTASEDLKHARRHLEIVELEQEQLLGEESDIDDEITRYNRVLDEVSGQIEQARATVNEKTKQAAGISARVEQFDRKIVDLKLQLTALNARLENSRQTLKRLKEFQDDGQARLEQMLAEIARKNQKAARAGSQIKELDGRLAAMYQEHQQLEAALAENESDYHAIDSELQENDEIITRIHNQRDEVQEKVRMLEIERTELNVKRENMAARLEEQYQQGFHTYENQLKELQKALQEPETELPAVSEMQAELADLRQKLANIGDVNLGAIAEYEQLKTRHDFLCDQQVDLQKAVEDLHRVIRKINRITQQRFMETFEQVNAELQKVFPRLFEGGSAQLVLTDPNNPLETGVEYLIHPPGKKLTRMSLLSGGEKALAAIAFIFSLFLIRPTAFCLMDEIDAPLDEANVYRFNNLLKLIGEKSQIVMVTHNKKTMEFADILFGITMETKGVSKVVSVNLCHNGQAQ